MSLSVSNVSSEEREQILQTIEMFEIIIQASPQDCQSMEILKEAYLKLGKEAEALGITRKLADVYVELGQYSQAMYEYEAILQRNPADGEVIAALSELEQKLHESSQPKVPVAEEPQTLAAPGGLGAIKPPDDLFQAPSITLDLQVNEEGTLMATDRTQRGGVGEVPVLEPVSGEALTEGMKALARFLNQHRLAPEDVVASALDRVNKKNADRKPNSIPVSLLDEVCRRGSIEMETLLSGIIERAKFAYIPLEYYDVDRAVVRMLPEHLTIGRLMVPFDVMSRTVMIAVANPLDAAAKAEAQQLLDYNIQWHLASPQAITQVLSATYKVGSVAPETISLRIAT
jgi:tetratricopeptide (TPR) repeat protein